jgi:pimeloyl-ACP methyl ester carboxylesterase
VDLLPRILGGCLAAVGMLGLFYAAYAAWRYKRLLKLVSIPLLLLSVLCVDAGTGYVDRGDTSPRTITVAAAKNAPNQLILLFHGYNGNGRSLANILGAKLKTRGTVVAFEPSTKGYNSDEVLAAAKQAIEAYHPSEVVLYGESLGGMEVMELLRRNPHLHVRSIVFNATPSTVDNVKIFGSSALKALDTPVLLHGGLISTEMLRANLAKDLGNAPSPEKDAGEVAARQEAYQAMRQVTGPTAFDELRFIADFSPPRPNEFDKRADHVYYLHAPGTADSTIKTAVSSNDLWRAFPHTRFADKPIREWEPDLHCPTPERPTPLINKLLDASKS